MKVKSRGMWGFGWVGEVAGKGVGSQEGVEGGRREFKVKGNWVRREPVMKRGCGE